MLHGSYGGQGNALQFLNHIDASVHNRFAWEEDGVTAAILWKMPVVLHISGFWIEEDGYASCNQAIENPFPRCRIAWWLQTEDGIEKSLHEELRVSLTIDGTAAEKRAHLVVVVVVVWRLRVI